MDKIIQYLNESPTIFFIYRKKENWFLEYVTNNVTKVFGYTSDDFLLNGVNYLDSIHRDDFDEFKQQARDFIKEQKEEYRFKPYRVVDGNRVSWISQISKAIKNKNGEIDQIYGYLTDISKRVTIEKNLQNYIDIVNQNVLISISDKKGTILDCSEAFCKASGYKKEELIGQKHSILRHKDSDNEMFENLWKTIEKGEVWQGEHKNSGKNGKMFWVENIITPSLDETNNITQYTSVYHDITHKKEISKLLITDHLTKIYNRRHFNDIFELELKRSQRHKTNFVLMIIDIDYFKQYNDTYGHHDGDDALIKVAQTLKKSLHRAEDFVFRLGGEEFGVITSDIDLKGAKNLATSLLKEIEKLKISHNGNQVSDYLTISIGIKLVKPEENLSYIEIYKLADIALYNAKELGRNRIVNSKY